MQVLSRCFARRRGDCYRGRAVVKSAKKSGRCSEKCKPGLEHQGVLVSRAQKFAQDSSSVRGKIKTARQGRCSIEDRDSNTPCIKKVRVASTVENHLSD